MGPMVNSPFTFFLLFCYSMLLLFQMCFDSLEVIWILIELLTFVFIGLLYVITNSSVAIFNGGVYFVSQSMLSIVLLVSIILTNFFSVGYSLIYSLVFILVILINIGVFPFSGWYQSSVYSLPIVPFFLALTFHNIPLLYMLNLFINFLVTTPLFELITFALLLNLVVFGGISNLSTDLRSLILTTSIANNVWLVVSCFGGLYIILYFVTVYFILMLISFSNNLSLSNWSIIAISGLPPFPIFFIKLLVLWTFLSISFSVGYLISITLILFTLTVSFSYLRFVFSRITTSI